MTTSSLKDRLQADMKAAMKNGDKPRLGTIRLMLASVKQREVDERIALDDSQIVAVIDKMCKQRRESIAQYQAAGREDLAANEAGELVVLQEYLPQPLTAQEIEQLISQAVAETGASSSSDMGKVMNWLRPQVQGRADMAEVSRLIKLLLSSAP